jgi:anti-anti-sigma regulatory factor
MTRHAATAERLLLTGALTIRTAEVACATLQETFTRHSSILIDCTGTDEVDLSFIQLLIAARASAHRLGDTVALAEHPNGALLDALTRAGFRVATENHSENRKTFWFEGAGA